MTCHSEVVRYGSLSAYRPGPIYANDRAATHQGRKLVDDLKKSNPERIKRIASWLASDRGRELFRDWFGPRVGLVPAPGHAPLVRRHDTRSATFDLVRSMEEHGLGIRKEWLRRTRKVQKSAWAPPGSRPTEELHRKTIEVPALPDLGLARRLDRILVIDDVITTGATLHACVCRLSEAFPSTSVAVFAVVRTMTGAAQVARCFDPVQVEQGRLVLGDDGLTRRDP